MKTIKEMIEGGMSVEAIAEVAGNKVFDKKKPGHEKRSVVDLKKLEQDCNSVRVALQNIRKKLISVQIDHTKAYRIAHQNMIDDEMFMTKDFEKNGKFLIGAKKEMDAIDELFLNPSKYGTGKVFRSASPDDTWDL